MAQSTPPADNRPSGLAARVRGFYAVLDRDDPALAATLVGAGARVLQVRLKPASAARVLAAAAGARSVTDPAGALLIVNDRLDLALAAGAGGVHLGQDDLPLADAIRVLGERRAGFVLGVSTHSLDQVRAAVDGGADYLGFGPVFATATKADPDPVVGLDLLARAVETAAPVPVVAIGGIGPDNAAVTAVTGVAGACAISAVNRAADPGAAARRVAEGFSNPPIW